ncbi:Chloride channel protein CLC-d [Tetrabaena socialis]|uniref:Chloride channel protein n=1 Tax=Tetrabaena socialis TaxID=47790 RepID=A0A2J7ZKU7_9CHLO|nr:Chloride channel protein CLC-d [Tetrabaena socialis]|eukprot:PNH00895.1 Chloride channel protein CLC-d [Tetrabaena socialis]
MAPFKLHSKRLQIPRLYTLLRWLFLIVISISTALVGFFQSMLVSSLYGLRSQFIFSIVLLNENVFVKFLQYAGFNLLLAWLCCFFMWVISPAASGSGIPDVKAYLNGVESPIFKNFFTLKTFIAKVISSALAVSSSLIIGKEGPMLHAGSILAVVMGSNKWMQQQMEVAAHWGTYTYNKEQRDLVAIGAACGVTTAFKAPVGGVMFAMEMSTRWGKEITWRCFLACAITIVVVREAVNLCSTHGHCKSLQWGSLIWFQIKFPTPYEQVWAMILLAIVGGYLGCLYISFNTWVCVVRKKWTKFMWARIAEVCAISLATSLLFFFMPVAGRCKSCDSKNDDECLSGGAQFKTFQGFHCHTDHHYNDLATLVFNPQGYVIQALFQAHSGTFSFTSMLLYGVIYWLMAGITYGAFIPSGLFTPSLIFGGLMGRMWAEVLVAMHVANEQAVGFYALLGAASFLGGLMRMSAAQALILMEMTQSPSMLPFLMLVLVISKNVGDCFNYGVFECQMMLKNLAFVGLAENNSKKSHINAADIMKRNDGKGDTLYTVEAGCVLAEALDTFRDNAAFPVTMLPADPDDTACKGNFVGMISRRNVAELIDEHGVEAEAIDLTPRVEVAPIIIPPNMPLPFIYRIVNAEGFNYVPVVRWNGPLEGLVSRADLVHVQNEQLDKFHLKEQLEKMAKEIEAGKIIGSMHLDNNIHANAFKHIFSNPVAAVREVLDKDDQPVEVRDTYYLAGGDKGYSAAPASHRPSNDVSHRPRSHIGLDPTGGPAAGPSGSTRGDESPAAGRSTHGSSAGATAGGAGAGGHSDVEMGGGGGGAGAGQDEGRGGGARCEGNGGADERTPLTAGQPSSSTGGIE